MESEDGACGAGTVEWVDSEVYGGGYVMDDLKLEHRLTVTEQRGESNTKRLDEIEKRQDDLDKLAASMQVLATRQETVEKDVTVIKSDFKAMTEKPGKRWDAIVDKVWWALLAAVLTFLLGRLGL